MEKMTLARALKEKNRLVGDINRLRDIITKENVTRIDLERKVSTKELYIQMNELVKTLVELKGRIAVGNTRIQEKIAGLSEAKSALAFLGKIDTRDTIDDCYGSEKSVKHVAEIDQEMAEGFRKELQDRINCLQDEVDEWNATCKV